MLTKITMVVRHQKRDFWIRLQGRRGKWQGLLRLWVKREMNNQMHTHYTQWHSATGPRLSKLVSRVHVVCTHCSKNEKKENKIAFRLTSYKWASQTLYFINIFVRVYFCWDVNLTLFGFWQILFKYLPK